MEFTREDFLAAVEALRMADTRAQRDQAAAVLIERFSPTGFSVDLALANPELIRSETTEQVVDEFNRARESHISSIVAGAEQLARVMGVLGVPDAPPADAE